jgi:probable O-glycosylation ligase (exosortase A-associated)
VKAEAVAIRTPTSRVAFGALVAFTGILLLSPQIWFPVLGALRIAFVAAGIAIIAHLLQSLAGQQQTTPFFPEVGIAIALVCWSAITLPVSYWPGGSMEVLTDHFLKAIAFFWLIGAVVTTTSRLRVLAWAFVICAIPLAITGVQHYASGIVMSTTQVGLVRVKGYVGGSGLVGNPNDLALMLNLIIPIAMALFLSARSPAARTLALVAALLSAVAVVLTFSRAGFLTLAATSILFVLWMLRHRHPGVAAVILVAGLSAIPFLPEGYMDRLSTITDIEADQTGSATGRWRDYQVALGVVASNPILGAGIGQDVLAMNDSRGNDWVSVHNAFLEYAVDLGLPGLILFVWLLAKCFRSARGVERRSARNVSERQLTHLAAGVQISLLGFVVAAFFHPIAYQFYFFAIAGLAVALKHTELTEHPEALATRAS